MLPYWLIFCVAAALSFPRTPDRPNPFYWGVTFAFAAVLVVFMGYRYEVGADWISYEFIYRAVSTYPLADAMQVSDPAYIFVNLVVSWFGGSVWHVNLICCAIFIYGLFRLCFTLPNPYLGIATAIPYLLIVVGMGFTRQATAIGCIMVALANYRGNLRFPTLAWLILAVTFHKSAIFMLPLFILSTSKNRTLNIGIGIVVAAFLGVTLIFGELEPLLELYVGGEMQSEGAGIRLALSASAAVFFFIFLNKRDLLGQRTVLWRYLAVTALALVPAYVVLSSSTVIDRLAFLLLPFQVFVYSYIPVVFGRRDILRLPITVAVIALNFLIMFVWLVYAEHSQYWLPYRSVLTETYLGSSVF